MCNLLVVVDMQNDFIDGALGTKEACGIIPNVIEKIKKHEGPIIYTRDTHYENYLETQEGKNLPVKHCIKDSEGWRIQKDVAAAALGKDVTVIDKPSFGSMELPKVVATLIAQEAIDKIELVGLCTDICVISNAMILKAAYPEILVCVDGSCCAGVSVESHENALSAMRVCQIKC